MKRLYIILGAVLVIALAVGAFASFKNVSRTSDKLVVSASFYPLAEVAKAVGGEHVEVHQIINGAIEPHDFEPTADQIAQVYASDIFIYNGAGFDPWAERLENQEETKGVRLLQAIDIVDQLKAEEHADEEHADESGEDEHASEYDPHFWLGTIQMSTFAKAVAAEFSAKDPEHAAEYQANANTFVEQLNKLEQEYRSGLATCNLREAIVSHNAFSYLAAAYNLEFIAIAGLSPDQEPSAQQLAHVARLAQEKGIRHIYYETLVSPKLSETIAEEIGATTLVLNPIEGVPDEDVKAGANYFTIMRDNLTSLRTGLQCQ